MIIKSNLYHFCGFLYAFLTSQNVTPIKDYILDFLRLFPKCLPPRILPAID